MPESIICDRGAHFMGAERNALRDAHAVRTIMAPTGAHNQVGTAERQVELTKRPYRKLPTSVTAYYPPQDKLALVRTAKNIAPFLLLNGHRCFW